MSAEALIQQISDELGLEWSESSQLSIVCEYIDNQQDDGAFEEFVRRRGEEELDGEEGPS